MADHNLRKARTEGRRVLAPGAGDRPAESTVYLKDLAGRVVTTDGGFSEGASAIAT